MLGFATIAAALMDPLKNGHPSKFLWLEACDKAFRTLQECWSFSKGFILQTVELGAVLLQEIEEEHPVLYKRETVF